MRWIPQLPGLDAWGRFVDWRRREIARLGNLELATGRAHARGRRAWRAAPASSSSRPARTGRSTASTASRRARSRAPTRRCPHILTPEQIMLGGQARAAAPRVVVIDVESYHVGASLALRLAGQGHEVTIATPRRRSPRGATGRSRARACASSCTPTGVVMLSDVTAEEIVARRRAPAARATAATPFEVEADAVVLVTQRLSDEALYLELGRRPRRARRGRYRGRLPHGRLRRPALARRHGLRRPPPGARDRQPEPGRLPADPARARPARLKATSVNYDPRCPATRPGGTERSEAGANPALSRNCDAPPGDEPGRLHRAADSSPRRKG